MGCVLGREVSSRSVSESKKARSSSIESNRKFVDHAYLTKVDSHGGKVAVQNGEQKVEVEEKKAKDDQQSREHWKQSRINTRPRNLPKHSQGEQVAAGWPLWLSEVCGEALSGWIPRRANSFEKIDKVSYSVLICFFTFILFDFLYHEQSY